MASESSDEDVVGPMPAPAAGAGPHDARASAMTAARELAEREARQREAREREAQAASAPSARPDWMLQMPSADVAGVPAGALRARGFQQSRGRAQRVEGENAEEAARLWTETPEERRTRIVQSKGGSALPQHHESDAERRARERAAVRDAAMREQAQALLTREEREAAEKDANSTYARPLFDKDKVLGAGSRLMDERARSRSIQDAAQLTSRFSSGASGAFL